MKHYRFSPIKSKKELLGVIKYIHIESHNLCKLCFGEYFENAGNIGIFCHYESEFDALKKIRNELAEPSEDSELKYYNLTKPIIINQGNVNETTYTHLYIRRPDPYRHFVGYIDFYLNPIEYDRLKQSLLQGVKMEGVRLFENNCLDLIELHNPDIDVLAYLGNTKMINS